MSCLCFDKDTYMNENYLELKERKLSILGCNWEGTGDLGGNETHFYPEPSCKV